MAENAVVRPKKSIVEWALRKYVGRPQSPAYGVDGAINNQTVRKSFSRKEGRLLRVRISAREAYDIKRSWHQSDFKCCDSSAEGPIESVEA